MSGIAGIIHFDGRPAELSQLTSMTDFMKHRGPDAIHHWARGNVALGHCMLQTTPESLEETQPLANEDESLILVADVRLDNWEELRAELLQKGVRLRTRADAELVLRAYEQWGRDCLAHIDGDFAFVIWDARQQEAFCARDRFGLKPFVYHFDGNSLSFASEVRPVLDLPWVPMKLNEGLVAEFLAADWYTVDETFWTNIMRLPPNGRMITSANGNVIHHYWQPDSSPLQANMTDDDCVRHYKELLFEAVRRCSRSHRPLACEVSGGLDSSALFAVAEELQEGGDFKSPSLTGYTLLFEGDPCANDIAFSRSVGEFFNRSFNEVVPTINSINWYKERASSISDFPGYPNGIMGLGIREMAVGQGSRALIVGVGGDEILTSERRSILKNVLFPLFPKSLQRRIKNLYRLVGLGEELSSYDWLSRRMTSHVTSRKESTSKYGFYKSLPNFYQNKIYSPYGLFARDSEELTASSVGIELRLPFFNAELVQYCTKLPKHLFVLGKQNKYFHRLALRAMLPADVLHREDKADFSVVYSSYNAFIYDEFTRFTKSQSLWLKENSMSAGTSVTAFSLWTLFALLQLAAADSFESEQAKLRVDPSGL